MKQRYEAVFFDLFHTLTSVEVSGAPGRFTHEILGIGREDWNRSLAEHAGDFLLGRVKGPVQSYAKMVHTVNPAIPDALIRKAALIRRKRFAHALTHIEPGTLQGLAAVKKLNLRTGLISNAGYEEITAWNRSPLAPFFEAAIFSCEVGLAKPDPEIYRLAARRLSVDPKKCLFVGDGGHDEHSGARSAGMTAVLLTRHLEAIRPEKIASLAGKADFKVRTISELVQILANGDLCA